MNDTYRALRVDDDGHGVLTVAIDAPPMNLVGPESVRDLVALLGELESDPGARVMVLESADPEYFVPHVDLNQVTQYTPRLPRPVGRRMRRLACCGAS